MMAILFSTLTPYFNSSLSISIILISLSNAIKIWDNIGILNIR